MSFDLKVSIFILTTLFINHFGEKVSCQQTDVEAFVRAVDNKIRTINQQNTKLTKIRLEKSSVEINSNASGTDVVIYENPDSKNSGVRLAIYFFENDTLKLVVDKDKSHKEVRKYIINNKVAKSYRGGTIVDCLENCYYGVETRGFQLLKRFKSNK